MAWAAPRTWVAGETVTRAMLADVFAQLRATGPALVTTAEDLIQGSGVAGTPLQRLAKGADGTALRAGTSLVSWTGAPTGVKVGVADLTDTITAGELDGVQWGSEEATVANPGVASVAVAWLSGTILGASYLYVDCEISLDGGSTWTHQVDNRRQGLGMSRSPLFLFHRRNGTPSGDVQARGWLEGNTGGGIGMSAYNGRIVLIVYPGAS